MASKSVKGKSSDGESSSSVPYCVMVRRERSRKLAQNRRTAYKTIMDDLTQVLPFPSDVVSQLDYNSRLRLALCFFRLKNLIDHSENINQQSQDSSQLHRAYSPEQSSTLIRPGMIQDLMTEALDGFLLVTLVDGTIVYLSESIHKHLGLFQSEHIGISVYDLILEEDHSDVRRSISKAEANALARTSSKGSAEVSFFCRMKCSRFKVANTVTKNPGYKLVYVSGNLKVSGSDPFMVVMVRPVSPPSILEIRMEGNMFVTHYLMDMKCTFFDARLNPLLGYTKADLVGNVPFHLHHHDDEEATLQCSVGVMTRGEGLSGYYRFLTKYGTYLWLQTRATVMHDSRTGKPSYIVCMNFVINKEDGENELSKRQAITAGKPSIREEDSRSHDPFPLVTREDGKVVNPFEERIVKPQVKTEPLSPDLQEKSAMKQEAPIQLEESSASVSASPNSSATPDSQVRDAPYNSTSLSSSSLSSGQHLTTKRSSVSADEPCLPDSTTSSYHSQLRSDSGSFDMGYHTDVSTKRKRNMSEVVSSVFSPASSVVHSDTAGSVCHTGSDISPKQNVSPYRSAPLLSDRSTDVPSQTYVSKTNQSNFHTPVRVQEQVMHDSNSTQQPNSNGDNQQYMSYQYNSGMEQHHLLMEQQAHHTQTMSSQHMQFPQPYNTKGNTSVQIMEPQGFIKTEISSLNFVTNDGSAAQASGSHVHPQAWSHSVTETPFHLPQNSHFQQPHSIQQPAIHAFGFQTGSTSVSMVQESMPSLPQLTCDDLKVLDYIEQIGSGQSISNVSEFVNRPSHH